MPGHTFHHVWRKMEYGHTTFHIADVWMLAIFVCANFSSHFTHKLFALCAQVSRRWGFTGHLKKPLTSRNREHAPHRTAAHLWSRCGGFLFLTSSLTQCTPARAVMLITKQCLRHHFPCTSWRCHALALSLLHPGAIVDLTTRICSQDQKFTMVGAGTGKQPL